MALSIAPVYTNRWVGGQGIFKPIFGSKSTATIDDNSR